MPVRPRRRHARLLSLLAATAGLLGALPATATAATGPRTVPAPTVMASLGDSISRGFDACLPLQDCPDVAWATGANPAVASHFTRLKAASPTLTAFNFAVTSAPIAALPAMASAAAGVRAGYVDILIGANDACRPTEAQMTSVDAFRTAYLT